tara:strand:+ start:292 stop:1848 length:1557 start_codon:yes stop_codon:yes gene_type:complete
MNRLNTLNNNFIKNNLRNKNLYYEFINLAQENYDKIIFKQRENNKWVPYTNKNLYYRIQDCRLFLKDNNIKKSDHIIFKGKNSVDWFVWNMASLSLGAVWIPIYHNQNIDYMKHVVKDSNPDLIIYDDDDFPLKDFKKYNLHKSNVKENIDYKNIEYEHNDLSHLIYTSGTSGNPKGVMLTHKNLLSNIDSINIRFNDLREKNNLKTLNILPWAHIYSLNTELYYNVLNQNTVYLNSGPENFLKELYDVKPDVLYLVPRVLEQVHKKLSFLDKPILKIVIPFILKKIFGENLITIYMGGAKLHENYMNFYLENGINICEGYGTTEASPMISVNHMESPRDLKSIGAILDNIDVKIINGEICVSGPNVTQGYYNNQDKNNESFLISNDKRYYKTGDAGHIKNNFLYYDGRISNNYKLSNGKFIEVDLLEKKINNIINNPFMIYGDNRQYNIIITENLNIDDKKLINEINTILPKYAQVKKILNLEENSFSKFLTPKMSLKRKELIKHYHDYINKIYDIN